MKISRRNTSVDSLRRRKGEYGMVDRAQVQNYLDQRADDARVQSVRKIGGGASRETWLLELETATTTLPRQLVIRKDAATQVPASLQHEYNVLDALARHGVRVARPFWFEADETWLGNRFYLREGFEGTSDQKRFSGETAAMLSAEVAAAVATLHLVEPEALAIPGMVIPSSIRESVDLALEHWSEHWLENKVEPQPMLEAITWWLRRNRPNPPDRPVMVWGDVGIANTVCSEDGHVLALSDWELATFGDPMRDLASGLWRGMGRLDSRQAFLDAYVAAGGHPLDEQRLLYFEVFMNWQVAILTHAAIAQSAPADHRSLHPALLSLSAQRINLNKAARLIGL
jgi:aminoglycoside phosphotransferase (APT) family kinase protein